MPDTQSTPSTLDASEDPRTRVDDPRTQVDDPRTRVDDPRTQVDDPRRTQVEDPRTQVDDPRTQPAPPPGSPVLVTEQEVAFATAAAVPLPRTTTGHRFVAMVRALLAVSPRPSPPRRHPSTPSRLPYIERARMAREMERL